MTDEKTPDGVPMPSADPPPGSDAPTTVTPAVPPPPPLAPLARQAAMPVAPSTDPVAPPPPVVWGAAPAVAPGPGPVAAQPAVTWAAAPAPAVAVKGKRTVLAAIAGILLLLGGIGGIILGLLVAVVGGTFVSSLGQFTDFGDIPELNGADPSAVLGGVVAFFGMIIVAYSVAYLLAGIGVLRNSTWARVLGIVVGIISGLIWLPGVTTSNQIPDASAAANSLLFSAVLLAIHVYIVVALLFFWRSKPPAV